MKKALLLAIVLGLVLAAGLAYRRRFRVQAGPELTSDLPGSRSIKSQALREIEAQLAGWPENARRAARRMIQKYGVPDEATPRSLIWNENGPWKRTVVRRDAGRDVLEQIASYHVPNDRYDVIGHLPGNVSAERGREELSARATDEALNFLSLNLADEVISGRRSAESAHDEYERISGLTASGKSSPYTESLLFAAPLPPPPGGKP